MICMNEKKLETEVSVLREDRKMLVELKEKAEKARIDCGAICYNEIRNGTGVVSTVIFLLKLKSRI